MDVDQIINDSLGYARSEWGKVATLGAIVIVPFILIILFFFLGVLTNNPAVIIIFSIIGILLWIIAAIFIYGYLFRIIKATIAGINDLPNFDDWEEMIMDGLKVIAVNIVYGILFGIIVAIPIVILVLIFGFLGSLFSPYAVTSPISTWGSGIIFWIMYLVIFIIYLLMIGLMLLYMILVPLGIANMASSGKIGSAFNFTEIRNKIESIRWGKAIIWAIAINFVITIAVLVSYILGLLLIGIILIPILVIPFMGIFFARSVGLLYLNN